MESKRIVITGAHGMLGTDITEEARRVFGDQSVIPLGHRDLDITDELAVESALNEIKPGIIVNAAAYTDVDRAETDHSAADLLNSRGPRILAESAARLGAKLIHFSTDQVFDGTSTRPWLETDSPHPLNYYAKSKWDGEREVLAFPDNLVFRVQWLYGAKKERFSQLKTKEVFTPFSDQRGAPTWTRDVARTVLQSSHLRGLYHFAYDDSATWAEVFQFVKEVWNLSVRLEPRLTSTVSLSAKRPLYSVLSNQRLKTALHIDYIGSWKTALREFLHGFV